MFKIDETILPYTWNAYTAGVFRSIRPGQRVDGMAVRFHGAAAGTTNLLPSQLERLGISAGPTDRAITWNQPVQDQYGRNHYPIFGKLDDGTDDYVVLRMMDAPVTV